MTPRQGPQLAEHMAPRTLTQAELVAEAIARFGYDPMGWAFQCPRCGDVATGLDFAGALAENPPTKRDGSAVIASDVLGQECIGRTLGVLRRDRDPDTPARGCNWCAYGLLPGPWTVQLPDGRTISCFPLAPAPTPTGDGADA